MTDDEQPESCAACGDFRVVCRCHGEPPHGGCVDLTHCPVCADPPCRKCGNHKFHRIHDPMYGETTGHNPYGHEFEDRPFGGAT